MSESNLLLFLSVARGYDFLVYIVTNRIHSVFTSVSRIRERGGFGNKRWAHSKKVELINRMKHRKSSNAVSYLPEYESTF